jgi:L-asparagine oxygenase
MNTNVPNTSSSASVPKRSKAQDGTPVRYVTEYIETLRAKNENLAKVAIHLTDAERLRAAMAATEFGSLGDYDVSPEEFEKRAGDIVKRNLPGVVWTLKGLRRLKPPLIVVSGLPAPDPIVKAPANGVVDQAPIQGTIAFLAGLMASGMSRHAFAFRSENGGRLARAVVAVQDQKGKASSQGFDHDLDWHNDNANQSMVCEAAFVPGTPFMNPWQGFAAIKTRRDVPMEVVSLDDVLFELHEKFGSEPRAQLMNPEFAVKWPDSHARGGEIAVENVPVLVVDSRGGIHSRYHAANVIGMNPKAQDALDMLREVTAATTSVIEIESNPGDLIVYSNTRAMHRRRAYTPNFDGNDRYYVRLYFAPASALTYGRVVG